MSVSFFYTINTIISRTTAGTICKSTKIKDPIQKLNGVLRNVGVDGFEPPTLCL